MSGLKVQQFYDYHNAWVDQSYITCTICVIELWLDSYGRLE